MCNALICILNKTTYKNKTDQVQDDFLRVKKGYYFCGLHKRGDKELGRQICIACHIEVYYLHYTISLESMIFGRHVIFICNNVYYL